MYIVGKYIIHLYELKNK